MTVYIDGPVLRRFTKQSGLSIWKETAGGLGDFVPYDLRANALQDADAKSEPDAKPAMEDPEPSAAEPVEQKGMDTEGPIFDPFDLSSDEFHDRFEEVMLEVMTE